MISSKLIQVLCTLSEKEFKDFEKKAHQQFYNNEKMVSFIEFLAYYYPKFNEEDISKENTYRFVYKSGDFEDIRIRELMSNLNKSLKDFLVMAQIKSSAFYYELDLLKQYQSRNLITLYNTQLKTVKKILNKDNYRNNEFFRRTYLLANVENDFFAHKQVSTPDDNIQIKLDNLDYYYFSMKLKESCDMLNRQKVLNHKYELNLFDEVESLIEKYKGSYLNKTPIRCYYEIFLLLQDNDNEIQLHKTLDILNTNIPNFTNNELKALFDFPQNYCIRNINKGKTQYVKILFKLQKNLIHKNFNLINGYLSKNSYNNIIAVALKLKEYKWSENFIEEYKEMVVPEFKENSYNINKANLYYSLKDYDQTILILNQVEFIDVYYAYYSKVLLLKTYYALEEFETLSYFITAFKLYLKRNKEIPSNYKKGADIFLSNFKKIFNIAKKIDFLDKEKVKEKLENIVLDIQQEKNIHNRVWLLEIIESLRK